MVVTTSAQHGSLFLSATTVDAGANSIICLSDEPPNRFTFEVAEAKGSRKFEFASGTKLTDISSSINTFKEVTSVSAVASAHFLEFKRTEFRAAQFVSLDIVNTGSIEGGEIYARRTKTFWALRFPPSPWPTTRFAALVWTWRGQ